MKRGSKIGISIATVLLGVAVTCSLGVSLAQAGCGGVETAKARKKVNPGGHAPLAIGDSTMLLSLPSLAYEGYQVNAHGCRQIDEGLALMRSARRHGHLPHLVVLALGADGELSARKLEVAFHLIGHRRVLGLITPRELGGWAGHDATIVRREARRHPDRAVLLDWVNYSAGHSSWFQPDGLHLTFDGAHAFARLFRRALAYARAGRLPGGTHHHHHHNRAALAPETVGRANLASSSDLDSAATAAFGDWIRGRFAKPEGIWECPQPQTPSGIVLCRGEFRSEGRWHSVSATAEGSGSAISFVYPFFASWKRRWTPYRTGIIRGFNLPGKASVNGRPAADWAFLAAGALSTLQYRRSALVNSFDGPSEGFLNLVLFRCKRKHSLITCRNKLGDAMRYRPRAS